ncbi:MAG: glyoxylate/hydroxypyruvate reductase A [Desulfobacterales bacterium]
MTMLFLAPELSASSWVKHLRRQDPGLDLQVWPDAGPPRDVEFIVCWKHPLGEFGKYPNLKCIASLGFGVDHILRDPDLPPGVPVVRLVDEAMTRAMSEYVVAAVLNHTRRLNLFRQDQFIRVWKPRPPLHAPEVRVGILGLGTLGRDAAAKLRSLGFAVAGWSRTEKQIDGVSCFAGAARLDAFLSRTDILVCLLPLTPATRDILDRRLFLRLPAGAYLVNAARGDHLVEEDLLAALDRGHLSGACLDVFRTEPLPADHPFWSHPQIVLTPHIASQTYPAAVAPQIVENYRRVRSGRAPLNLIDMETGY